MSSATGFSAVRAYPHERAVDLVVDELRRRGRAVEYLEVDGHHPDLRVNERLEWAYLDVKTGSPNLAIEVDSLDCYRRLVGDGHRVYIVHVLDFAPSEWTVDTPDSLLARMNQGPRRRSGNGSNDDWYLVRSGGTPFNDFFRQAA